MGAVPPFRFQFTKSIAVNRKRQKLANGGLSPWQFVAPLVPMYQIEVAFRYIQHLWDTGGTAVLVDEANTQPPKQVRKRAAAAAGVENDVDDHVEADDLVADGAIDGDAADDAGDDASDSGGNG